LNVLVVVGALQTGQSTLAGVPASDPSGVTRSVLGTAVVAVVVGYGGGTSALDVLSDMFVCCLKTWWKYYDAYLRGAWMVVDGFCLLVFFGAGASAMIRVPGLYK
jgi:hypothetical protein